MKLRYILITTVAIFISLQSACVVGAQTPSSQNSGLNITVSPTSPIPGQSVTITIEEYNNRVQSSNIAWLVNGKTVKSGVGIMTFTLNAPALGKTTDVQVISTDSTGQTTTGYVSVKSGGVDMIVEPDGYVPPFFLGKTGSIYDNVTRVIAIPHLANSAGKEYDPTTLVYQWKKDSGVVLSDQSGYGKQYIDMPGGAIPRPYSLTVTATTHDGSLATKGTVSIVPQNPFLGFYIDDPLYGPLYNKAVGKNLYIGSNKEVSVLAIPFGFNKAPFNLKGLSLTWMINNVEQKDLASNDVVTLRAPDGSSGSSNINLRIDSSKSNLQSAESNFLAVFSSGSTGQGSATSSSVTF